MDWFRWRPYVPVAVRRSRSEKSMEKLRKKGVAIQPVEIQGRKIARSFWGTAWCDHLERFSDYGNRLPRGRTYVRNGSVCHLTIDRGEIQAIVSGSTLYNVRIAIEKLPRKKWALIRGRCSGQIGSLLELLQGRISNGVMNVVTDRDQGLFPLAHEISLDCDCPDWATMCKHVAATLYGVGARLDDQPELLFRLRGVDHEELIADEVGAAAAGAAARGTGRARIADEDIPDVFGIEVAAEQPSGEARAGRALRRRSTRATPPPERPASRGTSRKTRTARTFTGKTVARLRARLGMSRSEFSRLLGVSPTCVGNWERAGGRLNLQERTRNALASARDLTPEQARRRARRRPEPRRGNGVRGRSAAGGER